MLLAHFDKGLPSAQALLFDRDALTPPEWLAQRTEPDGGEVRVFNPSLIAVGDGYAMCYRVALPVGDEVLRLLATCRLTRDLEIVPGSVTALSDMIRFAAFDDAAARLGHAPDVIEAMRFSRPDGLEAMADVLEETGLNERALTWHADPRYFRLDGRLFVSWNDGGNRPHNHQFMLEMESTGLRPAGKAREIIVDSDRRTTEKNWVFFEENKKIFCVYSVIPFEIFEVNLNEKNYVECKRLSVSSVSSEYQEMFGVLRGGAQPLRLDDGTYLSLGHSSYKTPEGRSYVTAAYRFAAGGDERMVAAPVVPLRLPNPCGPVCADTRLNSAVHEVVYVCGAVLEGSDVLVSYGINDEHCAICRVPLESVLRTMAPVTAHPDMRFGLGAPTAVTPQPFGRLRPSVPLFWWNPVGKRFDGNYSERRFKVGNFGDVASRDLMEMISGCQIRVPNPGERKLVAIGSVLHTAGDGDVIWGTGKKGTVNKLGTGVQTLDVHAVRGPLTLNFLRESGIDISKVREVFDPGCLVGELYREQIAAVGDASNQRFGPIRIIPHYRDDLLMRRKYPELTPHFVSVDCSTLDMVRAIAGAEAVFSSSLHGVIFAESLGIPAYWLTSIGGEDGFKFYDYYYGTGRYAVKRFDSLSDAFRATPMPLPVLRPAAYLETFPHEAVRLLARDGLGVGDVVELSRATQATVETTLERSTEGLFGPDVWWQTETQSTFRVRLSGEPGRKLVLKLTLKPFAAGDDEPERVVTLRFHDGREALLQWSGSDVTERTVAVPFTLDAERMDVGFQMEASRRSRPFRLPGREGMTRVAVGLTTLAVTT